MKKSQPKKANAIDALIDAFLANTFATPEQRKLLTESPESLRFTEFFIRHIVDLHNFVALFKTSYLPAANKTIAESRQTYQSSRYKSLFHLSTDDFRENVYETIRLGYVGLYHKLESFVTGLGEQRSLLKETFLQDDEEDGLKYEDVFKMLHTEFGVLRTDFKKDFSPRITAIRHTANRVKHDDGFLSGPNDELYKLRPWLGLVPGQRMRIDEKILFADMQYVKDYYLDIFRLILQVTLYFMISGQTKAKELKGDSDYSAPYTQLMRQQLNAFKIIIENTILLYQDKPYDEDFINSTKKTQTDIQLQLDALKSQQ